MSNGLNKTTLDQLHSAFVKFPALEMGILFGSRAKGTHTKGSDIDIAVKGLLGSEVVRLSMILNEEMDIPYFFDVISIESITNKELLDHIQRVGKVIYSIVASCE